MLNKIRTRIFIREAAQIIGTVLMVGWSILQIKKVKGIVDANILLVIRQVMRN